MLAARILFALLLLTLIAVIGLAIHISASSDEQLRGIVESEGAQYLGAPILVEELELHRGAGELREVRLGHPPGYRVHGGAAIEIDTVTFELDAERSSTRRLVFREIRVEGVVIEAIVRAPGESNLRALLENLEILRRRAERANGEEDRERLRFAIDELLLVDIEGSARAELSRRSVALDPEDVVLTGFAEEPEGDDIERALHAAIAPLAQAVDERVAAAGLD